MKVGSIFFLLGVAFWVFTRPGVSQASSHPISFSKEQSVTDQMAPLDPVVSDQILRSTVQITMWNHEFQEIETGLQTGDAHQEGVWRKTSSSTHGIGTLVHHQGVALLISHDHWSFFSSGVAPDRIEFHNAQGEILLEIAGTELLPLILFHDSGTFILKAPEALSIRASASIDIGCLETLTPGDIVQVVHHTTGNSDEVSLLAAEIVEKESFNGVPVLSLRSLNGQTIEPGDSGGGLWVNGRLVGNLWMTVNEIHQDWWRLNQPVRSKTAYSLAAGLSVELIDLIDVLLQVESLPGLEQDGIS